MRHAPRILWLAALGLCLLSVQLAADEPRPTKAPLTQVSITPTRVEWLPLADHKHLVLTVAGPEDFYLQRDLRAGEALSFSALDFQDNRLPDGIYAYELRAEGAPTQSGHLWVQEGRFVDKIPADLEPPIRSITALEEVIPDNLVVEGGACIGPDCEPGDGNNATAPLHIKDSGNYQIKFDGLNCCAPWEREWALQANDPSGSNGDFLIRDLTAGTVPVRIGSGVPDNALTILYNGNVGLGTLTPAERLHVFGNTDVNTLILSENSSTGLNAAGALRAKSNTATVNFQAHGSGRTLSRFGQTLGSWAEFLQVTGNGLIVGTLADKPLILGTNNANRVHIAADGKVGVGTSTPAVLLDVKANSAGQAVARFQNSSATGYSGAEYLNQGGTTISFLGVDNANNTTRLNSTNSYPLVILTNSVERMRATSAGDVGIGTSSPSSRLHVNGGDIRVSGGSFIDDGTTLNVPDYVFEPSYRLMPLDELREFVVRERHLPNVPSAEDVKKDGLNLSQVQMKLLEKLEELTLYTLKQDEQVKILQSENAKLNARLEALEQTNEAERQ